MQIVSLIKSLIFSLFPKIFISVSKMSYFFLFSQSYNLRFIYIKSKTFHLCPYICSFIREVRQYKVYGIYFANFHTKIELKYREFNCIPLTKKKCRIEIVLFFLNGRRASIEILQSGKWSFKHNIPEECTHDSQYLSSI